MMYKCKTCNEPVAESVIVCPHCGDIDAIYNTEIKTLNDEYDKKYERFENYVSIVAFIFGLITFFSLKMNSNIWLIFLKLGICWLIYTTLKFIGDFWINKLMKSDNELIFELEGCREKLRLKSNSSISFLVEEKKHGAILIK